MINGWEVVTDIAFYNVQFVCLLGQLGNAALR